MLKRERKRKKEREIGINIGNSIMLMFNEEEIIVRCLGLTPKELKVQFGVMYFVEENWSALFIFIYLLIF